MCECSAYVAFNKATNGHTVIRIIITHNTGLVSVTNRQGGCRLQLEVVILYHRTD